MTANALTATLLRRFSLRHWQAAPRQSALLVLILAVGIAVFFSIRLANRAAVASFQNFTDLITRESDWLISAPAGDLPETILRELREQLPDQAVQFIPVFETTATRPAQNPDEEIGSRETFQLLGIDLIGIQNLAAERGLTRPWFGQRRDDREGTNSARVFWETFRNPRAVFISSALAARDHLAIGDTLPLVINESIVPLTIAGIIPTSKDSPQAPASLLILDLPALQALAGRGGFLSRIEFVVESGPRREARRAALKKQLTALAQGRWLVSAPVDRRASAATMTRAFRLNLTILSLLALLVGLYLIFQALDGAVVRRREEIGILRSLGVEERSIRRAWLLEAACLGLAGGLLGVLLGWVGAQFSVRLVGRTVNVLYYATSVQSAQLDAGELAAALLLSISASLLAGGLPAREAARTPPAQILARHALAPPGLSFWRNEWLGLLLLLTGLLFYGLPPLRFAGGVRFPLAGYVAGLCWVIGGGLLGGAVLRHVARWTRPFGRRFAPWTIAASHLASPSGRHRMALGGLVCAIAMTAGMAILVSSFDATMRGWIARTFQADLYIASSGAQSASTQNRISPATWQAIAAHPAVAEVNRVQACEIQLPEGKTVLAASDFSVLRRRTPMAWVQAPVSEAVFDPEQNSGLALVSESFSERFRLRRGDDLTIPTPAGPKVLTIAGVFSDYGNERGSIVVDRRHYARWFQDEWLSSLIVFLKPGVAPEQIRGEWLSRFPGLRVLGNAHLRSEVLRVFRQTFAITYALEVIGVAVAVIGLGLTLASVLLERRPELTTLRALGMNRREMAQATTCEGVLLALAGSAVGVAVSVALGALLIYVINKQTFGWTLGFVVPWGQIALLVALVIGISGAVAYAIGRWGADLPADREE